MKNKLVRSLAWLVVVIAVGVVVWFVFARRLSLHTANNVGQAMPDDVAMTSVPDGSHLLADKTAGYQIELPRNWYFEKSAGSGVTIYPNYDPSVDSSPECKIEISTLPNPKGIVLTDWLTGYFAEDPTADIRQVSLTESDVAGTSGIIWKGSLNAITTTLAYVARGDVVYEIAPSGIENSASSSADVAGDCTAAFQSLIGTFQFLSQ